MGFCKFFLLFIALNFRLAHLLLIVPNSKNFGVF